MTDALSRTASPYQRTQCAVKFVKSLTTISKMVQLVVNSAHAESLYTCLAFSQDGSYVSLLVSNLQAVLDVSSQ